MSLIWCGVLSAQAAGPQSGTFTAISGVVELLTSPSRELRENEKLPHARFEGLYYLYREARVGDRVENGTFVRVRVGSKAQLVFDNGDQISLGSGTLFRPKWSQDSTDANRAVPQIDLPYGKVHALISKGGPRGRLKLRTSSMVLGVRGTEFSVESGGSNNAATSNRQSDSQSDRLTVLRGEVQLQAVAKDESAAPAPVAVRENQTAQVAMARPDTPTQVTPVQVTRTTREELEEIKTLAQPPRESAGTVKAPAILVLEKKASQVAINDVREYHPEWVKDLKADETSAQIQERVIERMQEQAPSRKTVQDLEREAYEKNFKSTPQQ